MSVNDSELASMIQDYLKAHPDASRKELARKHSVSYQRLDRIESAGLVKLPLRLSKSLAATLGRKKIK